MMKVAVLLIAMAISDTTSTQLDHYRGGGQSRSPDNRWRIWSHAPDADEANTAIAWLTGPGVQRRLLFRYERVADVIWLTDRHHALVRTSTAHWHALALFDLAASNRTSSNGIQHRIEQILAGRAPRLAIIENRMMAFGRDVTRTPCVLVSESGLPPSRIEGSYVERRAAFRLDPARNRVTPVARCPGAKLPA